MRKRKITMQKAYENRAFMSSVEARPLRILSEYIEPLKILQEQKIEGTIVFFGSARTPFPAQARNDVRKLRKNQNLSEEQNAEAERKLLIAKYSADATRLAYKLTKWQEEIKVDENDHFLVCSGGGPGMMEAANRGAYLAKRRSIGLNISLPFEQHGNAYITPSLCFEFNYFFMRKFWFMDIARALVVFPGGFGTFDELFEMLTLVQTKKTTKALPIVLFGREYWNDVINFDAMVKWGMIKKDDLSLFSIFDDVDEAFRFLRDKLS